MTSAFLAEYLGGDVGVSDFDDGFAPAVPRALLGERAPVMLDYLPTYYEASTFVRAMLQAEGFELGYQWYIAQQVLPTLTRPVDCPEWVLAMWEAQLRLPGRETWSANDRRRALGVRLAPCVQEAAVAEFLAAEARCSASQLAFAYATANQVDVTTAGLSAGQQAAVGAAAQLVVPAHLKITVDTVVIR
jgi:hypothetical protein